MKLTKGIGKNVLLLGFVSLLVDMSSEIITPILPLFIMSLGGTGLIVGTINGVAQSVASFMKVFSGYFSDRTGKRKPFVFAGYGISALSKIALSFSFMWQHVLAFMSVERIGKGLREAPRDALIAESVKRKYRGKGFGIHRMMDTTGAIIGSLIAFLLVYYFTFSYNAIIFFAGILALAGLVPIWLVKEKKKRKMKKSLSFGLKKLPKNLKIFIAIASLYALGGFGYVFFILRSQTIFSAEMLIAGPILLYLLSNVVYGAFSVPAGKLSDKIGRKKVIMIGYFLFVLVCFGFVSLDGFYYLALLFGLWGLSQAFTDANQRALVADLELPKMKGTAMGMFHMSIGLVTLPAGIIGGLLWDINPTFTFVYGATLAAIALVVFAVGFDEKR